MNTVKLFKHLAERNLKVGRLARIRDFASRNNLLKAKDFLTPMRAAWILYLYACAPLIAEDFKNWLNKKILYFAELDKKGVKNPIYSISDALEFIKDADDIHGLMIRKDTGFISKIDKNMKIIQLNHNSEILNINEYLPQEQIIFNSELLREISHMIAEGKEAMKEKFLI